MRLALALEYDGSRFCGWQSQPAGCGVQDALEHALEGIAGASVTTHAAGRTDAGVHATSQIVHFDAPSARPMSAWVRGVNALLPAASAVLWAHEVPVHFHARFSATARHYTYLLLNRPERPGLNASRVGWYHRPLDLDAMRSGALSLVGAHDFSSFRAAECQARSPVRTIQRFDLARDGDVLRFDISADAYLHHMIRNIVGALVYVGSGREAPGWIGALLDARDRTRGAPTFAPDGLYLTGADYDARFGMPPTRRVVVVPRP